jgi:hypothetical protein
MVYCFFSTSFASEVFNLRYEGYGKANIQLHCRMIWSTNVLEDYQTNSNLNPLLQPNGGSKKFGNLGSISISLKLKSESSNS